MTAPAPGSRGVRKPRRITDRHVYLLVALEVGVILLWAFWRLLGVELGVTPAGGTRGGHHGRGDRAIDGVRHLDRDER